MSEVPFDFIISVGGSNYNLSGVVENHKLLHKLVYLLGTGKLTIREGYNGEGFWRVFFEWSNGEANEHKDLFKAIRAAKFDE